MGKNFDSLDGWREENGIKNSKGEVKKYEGGCEYDATAEAIKAYLAAEAKKQAQLEAAKKKPQPKKEEERELGL